MKKEIKFNKVEYLLIFYKFQFLFISIYLQTILIKQNSMSVQMSAAFLFYYKTKVIDKEPQHMKTSMNMNVIGYILYFSV